MKKALTTTLLLLILITPAIAITSTALEADEDSQVRLLASGLVVVAEDDNTLAYYGPDGWSKDYYDSEHNLLTINNRGIGEEDNDNLYYYNETHLISVDPDAQETNETAYSGAGNGTLVAVTPNWYVFLIHKPTSNDPGLLAVNRDTLLNASNASRLNGTYGNNNQDNPQYYNRAGQAQYDPLTDRLAIPHYYAYLSVNYRSSRWYVLEDDDSKGPLLLKEKVTTTNAHEDIDDANDPGTNGYYAGSWWLALDGGFCTYYNVDDDYGEKPSHGALGYYGTCEYNGEDNIKYNRPYACAGGPCLHLFGDADGETLTYPDSNLLDDLLYSGEAINLSGASTTMFYAVTGDNVYYNDRSGTLIRASLNDELSTDATTYAKTYSRSTNLDDSDVLIRNYGNGTINNPYTPPALINSEPDDEAGVYELALGDETGSVETLDLLVTSSDTTNKTLYLSVDCDTADGYSTVMYEPWNYDTAADPQSIYDFDESYLTLTAGTPTPYDEYDPDVSATDDAYYLVFAPGGGTDPFTLERQFFASGSGTFSQRLLLYWNSTYEAEFKNSAGVVLATLGVTLNQTQDKLIITLDGDVISEENGEYNLGADNVYELTFNPTSITYDVGGVTGTKTKSLALPPRKVTWTLHTPDQALGLGPWAYYDDPLVPTLSAGTYAGRDANNRSYWYESCDYSSDLAGEKTVTVRAGVTSSTISDTDTFTYTYSASAADQEDVLNGTAEPAEADVALQGDVCGALGVCTSGGRLLLAVAVMVITVIGAMHAMSEKYHQTAATAAVPFMLLAVEFIFFAAAGFLPTWFVISGVIAIAATIAVKASFFTAFSGRGGGD